MERMVMYVNHYRKRMEYKVKEMEPYGYMPTSIIFKILTNFGDEVAEVMRRYHLSLKQLVCGLEMIRAHPDCDGSVLNAFRLNDCREKVDLAAKLARVRKDKTEVCVVRNAATICGVGSPNIFITVALSRI